MSPSYDWRDLNKFTASDYERRANQHRPSESAQLAGEVNRLRRQGLTALDIADALQLNPEQIRSLSEAAA